MTRRFLLRALGSAIAGISPGLRGAKPLGVRRVGWLHLGEAHPLRAFRERMNELGWIEGENLVIEAGFADNEKARLPALAADLIAAGVEVIVTQTTLAALAAQRATRTIPVVMAGSSNPVAEGLVASLSHPGGNVTGVLNNPGPPFHAKLVQLLRAAAPRATRIAVLEREVDRITRNLMVFASDPAVTYVTALADSPAMVPQALEAARGRGANALYFSPTAVNSNSEAIAADFARAHRWPSIGGSRDFVVYGGLMSYWASWGQIRRQAADYVDRILRGGRPADMPVEVPATYELFLNLGTARALGLSLPAWLRLRADGLID